MFGLAAGSILLFAGSIHGGFIWDDRLLISENPRLREPDYLWQAIRHPFPYVSSLVLWGEGMYRPVVSAAYGIEYRLFGQDTFGYHLVNLALNAACVVLVFFWLQRRLLRDEPGSSVPVAAALGAALFAVHPSHAETVAWISGSTDLWAAFWGLLALTVWDRFRGTAGAVLAGLLFVLSFYSKETGLMLPVALAVDESIRGGQQGAGRRWRHAAVVGSILAASMVLRHHIIPGADIVFGGIGHSLVSVVATFGGYLRISLWPWPPSTQVGYLAPVAAGARSYPAVYIALGLTGLVGFTILALAAWRRPSLRPWLADAVWFVAPLIPVLNFVEVNPEYFMYERSLYLSAMGWAAASARLWMRVGAHSRRLRTMVTTGAGLLLAADAAGAALHALHFVSGTALWSYEAHLGHMNEKVALQLTTALSEEHRYSEAKAAARQGIKISQTGLAVELINDWMDADFQQAARQGNDALTPVRRYHDEILAGAEPEGEIRGAWEDLNPSAREFLRTSVFLAVRRARIAIALGDFANAAQQLASIRSSSTGQDDPILPTLLVALVGQGAFQEATRRMNAAGAGLGLARDDLMKLIDDTTGLATRDLSPLQRENALSSAFCSAREWLAAIAVVNRALAARGATDTERIPLLVDRLTAESMLGRAEGLQRDAETLKQLDPKLGPDLDRLISQSSF